MDLIYKDFFMIFTVLLLVKLWRGASPHGAPKVVNDPQEVP